MLECSGTAGLMLELMKRFTTSALEDILIILMEDAMNIDHIKPPGVNSMLQILILTRLFTSNHPANSLDPPLYFVI